MAWAGEKKLTSFGTSYGIIIDMRWAKPKRDSTIGVLVFDLADREDQLEYENMRKRICWK